jgi:type VI secretion system protein ImpH
MEDAAVSAPDDRTGAPAEAGVPASYSPGAAAPAGDPAARQQARARRRLERALRDEPTSFGFFQAVRLLARLRPDRARVGGWADPKDEVVRFAVPPSLGFPPQELQALELPDEGEPRAARMEVNFIGLTGPQGVLPQLYTEHAAVRARARDTAFRDFLDLFHHRIVSLFYRAWERAKFAIAAEERREDRLRDHLLDLAGIGTQALRQRLPVPDDAIAFYAGLFASRARPADGLARLVADYFGVDARVEQFVGAWRRLDRGGQCELGADGDAGRLGWGVVGDEAWDPQARVRLRLGPLTRRQYDAFLPGGAAHATLSGLCRFYADDQVEVEAQLVLARAEVPPVHLGAGPRLGGASPPLGRGTWLASRRMTRDPDETVLVLR